MNEDVFVDTKDDFHNQAIVILQKLKSLENRLITSNFILDETFTVIRSKCSLELAMDFKEALEEFETDFMIVRVLVIDERNAWEYFSNNWKDLSFTDCVSFALMKRLNIKNVAGFDNHFKRAGYKLIS